MVSVRLRLGLRTTWNAAPCGLPHRVRLAEDGLARVSLTR
jgi:hypothetical protein